MSRLALSFLGPLQIILADEAITNFRSDKERALLAFLALEAGRPHRREALIGLLWPEQPEALALNNLRKALHRLRQTLHDSSLAGQDQPFLLVTPKTVQFNPTSDHGLDVAEFTALLDACQQHPHRHLETCASCSQRLRQAVELYRGELLHGFFLADCVAFDEWILVRREWLRRQVLDALHCLAEFYARRAEYALAQGYALRQLAIEPWRESAHRQLMWVLASKGERSEALAQYAACQRVLAKELGVEPDAETRRLYEQICGDGLNIKQRASTQPPAERSPAASQKHNLPIHMTPFIGREAELEELTTRLLDPAYRLVTLVGEGGIGKTRLAYAAAEQVRDEFLQGVWLVPLAGSVGGELPIRMGEGAHLDNSLSTVIATALGCTFFGNDEPKTQLLNYLRQKELLLVLDNFEQWLAGADLILEILKLAPKVGILVTSREPLNFQAEHVFRLDGLPVPPTASDPEAGAYSSVQLFAERAQRIAQRFILDASTLPAVVQVCQFLGGLPLGIELAAAWVRRRTPTEIAQALHEIDFLTTTQRDVAARHRSMRAVFEGSWQLLSERHQAMLAQASVFRGGSSEQAARAVLGAAQEDIWALVDKSLLRQSATGRYEMHELLRQFAAEKLASDLEAQVSHRHSAFYLEFLAQREAAFRGRQPQAQLAEIRGELENIHQAWSWAVVEMRLGDLDRGLNGLAGFYDFSYLHQEGIRVFELTIERISATLDLQLALPTHAEAVALLARLWMNCSRCLFNRARYEEAAAAAQQAIQLAQTVRQVESEAMGYLRWGYALWRGGDFAAARAQIEQALQLAEALKSPNLEADCLRGLGNVAWNRGDLAEAQTQYEQALRRYRATGDGWSESRTLTNLGMVAASQDDHLAARAYYEQALSLCRNAGDAVLEFHIRSELGTVALEQGSYAEAQAYFEQALRSYRQVGDRYNEGAALGKLGDVSFQQGDYQAARMYYEQALSLFRAIGARLGESLMLAYLGLLAHDLGDNQAARTLSQRALQLAQGVGARREQGYALTHFGHALAGLGHLAEAVETYHQAIAVRQSMGARSRAIEPLAGLARVALDQGDLAAALAHVEEILVYLEIDSLAGADAPFRVYLTCYRVLQAQGDSRAAPMLQLAHGLLQARAVTIADERLRRSFLENVPTHRELLSFEF